MKRLLSSIILMSGLLGNSAMAAEVSIFKNGKIISSSQINIQGARNGSASTHVRDVFIDSNSGEVSVLLSTDYGIDKRVNNSFRHFNCRQKTAVLTMTVTFEGRLFDQVNRTVNEMFESDMGLLTPPPRDTTVNSNELVRFDDLTATNPTLVQTFKNICNYRN